MEADEIDDTGITAEVLAVEEGREDPGAVFEAAVASFVAELVGSVLVDVEGTTTIAQLLASLAAAPALEPEI